jgi:hypothetical protein
MFVPGSLAPLYSGVPILRGGGVVIAREQGAVILDSSSLPTVAPLNDGALFPLLAPLNDDEET